MLCLKVWIHDDYDEMVNHTATSMSEVEIRVKELEKKVELLAKAVSIIMIEREELSEEEG